MAKKISGSGIGAYAGVDQGVDFTSKGLIPALAHAIVTDVGKETDLEGQHGYYVIYKLLSGPRKGQYVYNAETLQPTVKVGQRLKPGQTIGINQGILPGGAGTGIEIGFNAGPKGWMPSAPLGSGAAAHGPTSYGQQMWEYIQAVEKGLPGPSGSSTPLYSDFSSGGGGKSGTHGAGDNSNSSLVSALVQSVLSNNAGNRQTVVPQINPIKVNPALNSPMPVISPLMLAAHRTLNPTFAPPIQPIKLGGL